MELEKKKKYILDFVSQGLSLEKAYDIVFCADDEIERIAADEDFNADVREIKMNLSLARLDQYNARVDASLFASDHLKRLTSLSPEIVSPEAVTVSPVDMQVTIVKNRG